MSYDISIYNPNPDGDPIFSPIKHDIRGGTYVLGGTNHLEYNITFNYSNHFQKAFQHEDGIKILDGMSCMEAIPLIVEAMHRLGDDVVEDYWELTEGNAKKALDGLLHLAALGCKGSIAIFY